MVDVAVDLLDPAVQACPYPAYQALRDDAPVYLMPETGYYVVTRYEDLRAVVRDTATFSSDPRIANVDILIRSERARAIFEQKGFPRWTPFASDPPMYRHYREIVDAAFDGIVRRNEQPLRRLINQLIDGWGTRTEVEFVSEFCIPLPMTVIVTQLGLPLEDVPLLRQYSDAWAAPFTHALSENDEVEVAERSVAFQHYLVDWLARKRADPQDDALTILATSLYKGERLLTDAEATAIAAVFLTGGNETTTSALAMSIKAIIEGGLENKLRGDPKAIRIFVEESLRLHAPTQGLWRYTTRDAELGGVTIPKGKVVHIRFAAANRDERHFARPDDIDLVRKNAGSHFSFNQGLHHCPGAPLARREMQLSVEILLDRLSGFRFTEGHDQAQYLRSLAHRGLRELHISFDRGDGAAM